MKPSIIEEVPRDQVKRLADIIGESSAAAHCLAWEANSDEVCRFFRAVDGSLIVVKESELAGTYPVKRTR